MAREHEPAKRGCSEHVTDPYVKRASARRLPLARGLQAGRDRGARPAARARACGRRPRRGARAAGRRSRAEQVGAGRAGDRARLCSRCAAIPGVTFIQGDFRDEAVAASAGARARRAKASTLCFPTWPPIFSGIARSGSGARHRICANWRWISRSKHLKPEGICWSKLFQGAGFDEFLQQLRRAFGTVASRKPDASREPIERDVPAGQGA